MAKVFGEIKHFLKRNKLLYKIYGGLRGSIRKKSIRAEGSNVLRMLDDVFTEIGISYFIDFGTLLGFIREGSFIAHDLDIDIGILDAADDYCKSVIEEHLLKNGFKKVHEFIFNDVIAEQAYVFKGVKVDLFYYEHEEEKSYCFGFFRFPEIKYAYLDEFSVFKFIYKRIEATEYRIVSDLRLSVPKNPEDVLAEKYGFDWEIPNKSWTVMDAPTMQIEDGLGILVKKR